MLKIFKRVRIDAELNQAYNSDMEPMSVQELIDTLPEERRCAVSTVRETILRNLQPGFEEGIQYGSIGYYVSREICPAGYHCDPKQPLPFINLASNKTAISLHLMCLYGNQELTHWLNEEFSKAGKKLKMGKACVTFKNVDAIALDAIGELVRGISAKDYAQKMEIAAKRKK